MDSEQLRDLAHWKRQQMQATEVLQAQVAMLTEMLRFAVTANPRLQKALHEGGLLQIVQEMKVLEHQRVAIAKMLQTLQQGPQAPQQAPAEG